MSAGVIRPFLWNRPEAVKGVAHETKLNGNKILINFGCVYYLK